MRKEVIGDITLYCGDSLELLRAGVFGKIGAIVSDPPYGIGYQHGGGRETQAIGGGSIAFTTAPIKGDSEPFDPAPWIEATIESSALQRSRIRVNDLSPRILLWGADRFRARLPEYGTLLAWDKHLGRGPDDSFTDCEWAWSGRAVKREVFRHLWKGVVRDKSSPLDQMGGTKRLHVSQKPVELMRWSIEKARPMAGLPILDPYMGSGSTLIAAMSLGLPAIGCELDEEIFELACLRVRHAREICGQVLL